MYTLQIVEEGEWCLYTVTILKGQYQAGFYDGEQVCFHIQYLLIGTC
jgi:hypothetical protein